MDNQEATPDPERVGIKAEVMRQYRIDHPDATTEEIVARSDELDEQMTLTRVQVIPGGGRPSQEFWADYWTMSHQDGGATLKLFGHGQGQQSQAERDDALREFIQFVQPTLPSPLAQQAAKLLANIARGEAQLETGGGTSLEDIENAPS